MKVITIIEPLGDVIENEKVIKASPYVEKIIGNVNKFFANTDIRVGAWTPDDDDLRAKMCLEVEKKGGNAFEPPQVMKDNTDAEIVIGSFAPFGSNAMDTVPNARVFGVIRAGLENIDVQAATERGIAVVNASGRNANAVSDFTIAMILCEIRNIARSHSIVKNGGWNGVYANDGKVPDLFEKTIGIVGFGYIGKLVAEKLAGFKTNIIAYDPFVSKEVADKYNVTLVDKETLFKNSDIVTVHARLTEETKGMIGKNEISLMKENSYFINTARADLVDYDALLEALKEKKIMGAALDVFPQEPLPEDSEWRKLNNVTMTTHLAGRTIDAQIYSPFLLCSRVVNLLMGRSTDGLVNREVLDNPAFKEWAEKVKESGIFS